MKTYTIVTGVVRERRRVLTIKRSSQSRVMPNLWEFPSGNMKEYETAEDAMLRELEEETGLAGTIERTSEPIVINDDGVRWVIIPFLISVVSNNVMVNQSEHSEYLWID